MNLLATDLDGTFIPLTQSNEELRALEIFRTIKATATDLRLLFITGRDLSLVNDAIAQFHLPMPDTIICDVGSSIYHHIENEWVIDEQYNQTLQKKWDAISRSDIEKIILSQAGVKKQEASKQGTFKISFYIDTPHIQSFEQDLTRLRTILPPCEVIVCHDPHTGGYLLDLLPNGVSKAFALHWYLENSSIPYDKKLFAGDSGNDLALFLSPMSVVMVSNTPETIAQDVLTKRTQRGEGSQVLYSSYTSTAGVLDGCTHFGIINI